MVFAGAAERLNREYQWLAWLAWHVAALPRMPKFPSLEELTGTKRQPRAQSPEQMKAVFAAMRAKAKPAKG